MTPKLTDKGRLTVIMGDSVILRALYDDIPLELLPLTPEEREQQIGELIEAGYIKKDGE